MKRNPYIYTMRNSLGEYVMLNTYNSTMFKASPEQSEMFENAYETLSGEQHILDLLEERNIIYDESKTAIDGYEELYQEFIHNNQFLHLVILPTENCNFRCIYCYEEHESKIMSQDVQDGIVNYVEQHIKDYQALRVEWFGGEPLCQKEIINNLSKRLKDICKANKKPYYASMTTNGYLLDPETFKMMHKKNGIMRYQITIDGLAESHNKQRALANGKPTFDTIIENLRNIRDNAKSSIVNILIRCNITEDVLENFDDYVSFIQAEFGEDDRFELLWKIAWNPEEQACQTYCGQDTLHTILGRHKDKVLKFGTNRRQFTRFGDICYASNKHSFVIGSDGRIYKCTVSFDKEINMVGHLQKNGEMILDEKKFKYWTERKACTDHELCQNCSIYPSCLGLYCGLNNVDSEGRFVCAGIKEYVDDYLEHISKVDDYYYKLEV